MTLSSLAVMGMLTERFVRGELGRQAQEGSSLLAASVAHEVYSLLDAHFTALSLLDDAGFRDAFGAELLRRSYLAFGNVLVTDAAGRVVLATETSSEKGFDLSTRDYFRIPTETRHDYVSPAFIAEARYTPSAVLAHPFEGGVAIAYVDLRFMNDFVSGLPSSKSKSIAVVDARGVYVAHNADPGLVSRSETISLEPWFQQRLAAAEGGSSTVAKPDGSEELLHWAAVQGASGWTVVVSEPADRVFRALSFLRMVLFLVLAAYALLSLLVNASVIRFVRKDLNALVRFSQELADGNLGATIDFRGFYDFGHLAANMERMGSAIREREASLKSSERRLFNLIDFLPIPVILLNHDLSVELMNKSLTATLGWTAAEIRNEDDWWLAAYPDKRYREEVKGFWALYIEKLVEGKEPERQFRGRIRCKDGSYRTMLGAAALIADRFIVTFVDITQADEAAARTAASLREKEVLLKEIHHRVKNNLQLVVSLLSLKASASPETESLFDDSIDRIRVMAGIHELLYQAKDLSHIDLYDYVQTILDWLISSYTAEGLQPRMEIRLEHIELDIDKAIPCGLIINEVITNSLKYAFKAGAREPAIGVSTSRRPDGSIVLELYDNGSGLPPGMVPERCDTLGMQLVLSLCAQLNGSWNLSSDGGTRWTILFEA